MLLWNISEKGKKASEEFHFLTKDKLSTNGKVISSKYEKFETETDDYSGKISYHELDIYHIVYQFKTFDGFNIEDSTYVNKKFSKDDFIKIEYVKDKPNISKVEYDFDFNERVSFFNWLFSNFMFGILGLVFTFYLYYLSIKIYEKEKRELDIINDYKNESSFKNIEKVFSNNNDEIQDETTFKNENFTRGQRILLNVLIKREKEKKKNTKIDKNNFLKIKLPLSEEDYYYLFKKLSDGAVTWGQLSPELRLEFNRVGAEIRDKNTMH